MASTHLTEGALHGRARTSQAVATLAPQFGDDPCFTYLLNKLPDDERLSYLATVFRFLVTAAVANDGTIYEAADWQSAAVVLPPGRDVANPVHLVPSGGLPVFARLGVAGTVKMLYEFPRRIDAVKNPALRKRRFYYVFLVATVPGARGRGLASALIRQVLDAAQRDRVPAWIEASTEASRRVYAKAGFRELDAVVLGKGKCDAMGVPMKGGPGVTVWPMIWEPSDTTQQPEKSSPV